MVEFIALKLFPLDLNRKSESRNSEQVPIPSVAMPEQNSPSGEEGLSISIIRNLAIVCCSVFPDFVLGIWKVLFDASIGWNDRTLMCA